ncbi:hypothetical protein [Criblamydia sequanensis]|uniref:Secreted protein n=1 Tax=Candidatus Criblamydia sequanensis CRIB-18 TaxID=1437425 RepID=A0A090D1P9_9BACT|nr:hypothetical protein [Criblamydia sequanensis]CDR33970.1 putative secreted protein [Criblamydia sequanensis CRIB-18]
MRTLSFAVISFIVTSTFVYGSYTPSGTKTPEIRSTIIGEPRDHINPIPTTKNESSDKIGTDARQRLIDNNRRTFENSRRKIDEQRYQDNLKKISTPRYQRSNKSNTNDKDMINR